MAEHTANSPVLGSDGQGADVGPLRLALPLIFLLAIVLRAVVAVRTSVIFEDGPYFLDIAQRFAAGDFAGALAHPYHPLYSALTAAVQPLFGDFEKAALAVSVLSGSVAVAAAFVFLRDAFDTRVAAFGALAFAISPYAVRFSADVQSEGLYLACFVGALALLWRGIESGRSGTLFAAGLAAGFAYLTRPEGAGLVVVGSLLLMSVGGRSMRESLAGIAALAGGALGVAMPYLVLLSAGGESVVLSGKKSLIRTLGLSGEAAAPLSTDLHNLPLFGGVFLALIGLFAIALLWRSGVRRAAAGRIPRVVLGFVLAGLVVWQLVWPGELKEFASVVLSSLRPEVAVLVGLGLWVAGEKGWRRRDLFIAAVLVAYGIVLVGLLFNYGYLSRRHVLPLLPLLLGYAGMGVGRLAELVPRVGRERVFAALAIAVLLIAAPKTLHDHREDVLAQRLAAEWLREQDLAPGRVASNKRRAGYYAERKWFPLLAATALQPLERLAQEKVRYIVADDRVLGFRDDMPPQPGFEARELHRVTVGGRTAMVYELVRSAQIGEAGIAAGPPERETR